jgi:hypothetical protein
MKRILGLPADDPARAAHVLVEQGFDSLVVGTGTPPDVVEQAAVAGLAVWAYRGAFSVRDVPGDRAHVLLAQDVDGVARTWFGSGCPNRGALRDAHLAAVERLVRSGLYAGFMLDGIRFASPHAGEAYFTCFCPVCRAKAGSLGFDFEGMRRDVAALRDWCRAGAPAAPLAPDADALPDALRRWPGVDDWLRFRAACVSEHVGEVRRAIDTLLSGGRGPFGLGAYLFTPALAKLVGQRYGDLAPLLDVLSPMIYRANTDGDAALASEWGALAGLHLIPARGGFSVADVGAEVARARAVLATAPAALVPILRLADDLVAETTRAALAAGADGLDYFVYRVLDPDEAFVRRASNTWLAESRPPGEQESGLPAP